MKELAISAIGATGEIQFCSVQLRIRVTAILDNFCEHVLDMSQLLYIIILHPTSMNGITYFFL